MSTVSGYRIVPAWPDTIVYDEGEGRVLRFDCRAATEPPQVVVPSAARWIESLPPWAHGRRSTILARLRAAGCVAWTCEDDGSHVESADGRIVLRVAVEHDERMPPAEWVDLWWRAHPGDTPEQLIGFRSHGLGLRLRFTGPASLVLDDVVDGQGRRWPIMIDTQALTFSFHPDERPMPLGELPQWLGPRRGAGPQPVAPAPAAPLRRTAAAIVDGLSIVGGLLFAAAGAWMALAGSTPQDRLTGLFGLLFFGACAAWPLWERLGARSPGRPR